MDHEATPSPTPSPSERAASVVHELETLEDTAIDHHVAAFELAHAKLRGLLTDDGHLNHQPRAAS